MGSAKPVKKSWYAYTSQNKYLGKIGLIKDLEKKQADEIANSWERKLNPQLPKQKFDLIYADPPWRYDFSKSKSRAIESHYQSMSLEDICNLDIDSITKQDSILYLWATAPKLLEALEVMKSWGFNYTTNFVWIKDKMGMGYHSRGQHELLLIGKKGKISPPGAQVRYLSVITASRGNHSKKPDLVYNILEQYFPPSEYKLIELFARNKREGWESWGNELN